MNEVTQQKVIAFLCGNCLCTIYSFFGGIVTDIGHFGLKVLATIVLGIAGGVAGLVGKDLYNRWKVNKKNKKEKI